MLKKTSGRPREGTFAHLGISKPSGGDPSAGASMMSYSPNPPRAVTILSSTACSDSVTACGSLTRMASPEVSTFAVTPQAWSWDSSMLAACSKSSGMANEQGPSVHWVVSRTGPEARAVPPSIIMKTKLKIAGFIPVLLLSDFNAKGCGSRLLAILLD